MKNIRELDNAWLADRLDMIASVALALGVLTHWIILIAVLVMPADVRADVGDFRSWGSAGRTQFSVGNSADFGVEDVVIGAGGTLIVGTSCNAQASKDWCFTKLNVYGGVDTAWGTNSSGSVIEATPEQDVLRGMAALSDGGWYAYGSCGVQSCLGRYRADGSRNATFGGGRMTFPGLGIYDVAIHPDDGRVAYAGECFANGIYHACVGRVLANGQFDPSFNGGQIMVFAMGSVNANSEFRALSIKYDLASDRYWIAGRCRSDSKYEFCVARIRSNGQLDTAFTPTGWFRFAVAGVEDISTQILLRPDGFPVLVGHCRSSTTDPFFMNFCVAEVAPWTGALNSAFGNAGTRMIAVAADAQHLLSNRSAFLQSDGALGIAGDCAVRNAKSRACFVLLAANGTDDRRLLSFRATQSLAGADTSPTRLVRTSRVIRGPGELRTIFVGGSCGDVGGGAPCLGHIEWANPRGGECTLDLDGDGKVLATTDGAMLVRIAAGMRGQVALNGITGPGTRQAWEAVQTLLVRDCGVNLSR